MSPLLATASLPNRCEQFFSSTKLPTLRAATPQSSIVPISAEQLLSTNPRELDDRGKALFAKGIDYMQRHEAQTALELMELGLAESEVIKIMIPAVKKDLDILESEGPKIKLFDESIKRSSTVDKIKSKPKNFDEFSDKYDLASARDTMATVTGFRFTLKDSIDPANVLKAAIMTKNKSLMNRAFQQALKFGHFSELTAMAAEMKNDWALIELGKLSLARYLYFHDNTNWLSDGLRSFTEVTGPEKKYVDQMLFDLFDLLHTSPKTEHHTHDLVNILVTTLPVTNRFTGDSSARFVYQHALTNDSKYISRVKNLMDSLIATHETISELSKAIIHIQNPEVLLQIAKTAEAYSHKVNDNWDAQTKDVFILTSLMIARDALTMSGNHQEITSYYKRVLTDERLVLRRKPMGFPLGENVLMVPKEVLDLFRSFVANPSQIAQNITAKDLSELTKWLESYNYYAKNNPSSVSATSKMFYKVNFWHEESVIQSFLKDGENATPKQIQDYKISGAQKLKEGYYWESMAAFISARDLVGLDQVYHAMLTRGRPVDAVYAANAIEWIRTGRSPFGDQALTNGSQQLLE